MEQFESRTVLAADIIIDDGAAGFSASGGFADAQVDNSDFGYAESGSGWLNSGLGGVNGNSRYSFNTGATASYTFTNVPAGSVTLQINTPGHSNSAIASYSVNGSTFTFDQRNSTNGWATLGTISSSGGTVVVNVSRTASSGSNTCLRTDALRLQGAGWTTSSLGGHDGDSLYAYSNAATAAYNFSGLTAGSYEVLVNTPGHANSTASALHTVTSGGQTLATYTVDQQPGTGSWKSLGVVDVTASDLTVTVSKNASGVLRADAVRIRDVTNHAPVVQNAQFNVDENSANGTVVGTPVANDPDPNTQLQYSITGSYAAGPFAINATTGEITVSNSAALNFETPNLPRPYNLTVQVSDGSLTATSTVTITVDDVAEAPQFLNDPYAVVIGRQTAKDGSIFATAVADPYRTYSYRILSIDAELHSLFTISSKGVIKMGKNAMEANFDEYTFELEVREDLGGGNFATDTADMTITIRDAVGISGDTQAVEGGVDNINLTFVRYVRNASTTLRAHYVIAFGNSTSADFYTSDWAALLRETNGDFYVDFAANSPTAQVTLRADYGLDHVENELIEGVETFTIAVTPQAGATYMAVQTKGNKDDKTATTAYSALDCEILEGVTLYGKNNPANNGALADSSLPAGNPGIHPNDVGQQGVGDCWLMGAMSTLARTRWQRIHEIISENPDGSFSISLHDPDAPGPAQAYPVPRNLTRGYNAAGLSGDTNDDGLAEIWPLVLEQAYAVMQEGYPNIGDGGYADDAWYAFTGERAVDPRVNVTGESDASIMARIVNALAQGQRVVIATPTNLGRYALGNGTSIYGNHAYEVVMTLPGGGGPATGVQLENPWAGTGIDNLVNVDSQFLSEKCASLYFLGPAVPQP